MAAAPTIPYFAPADKLPAPLPVWEEFWNVTDLAYRYRNYLKPNQFRRRIGEHYLVEYGESVLFDGAKIMMFLQQTTAIPVPTVYAMYEKSVVVPIDDYPFLKMVDIKVIVREWIPGIGAEAYQSQPYHDWHARDAQLKRDILLGQVSTEDVYARRRQLTHEHEMVVWKEATRRAQELARKFRDRFIELRTTVPPPSTAGGPTWGAIATYRRPTLANPVVVDSVEKWCEEKLRDLEHLVGYQADQYLEADKRKMLEVLRDDKLVFTWAHHHDRKHQDGAVLREDGELVLTNWDSAGWAPESYEDWKWPVILSGRDFYKDKEHNLTTPLQWCRYYPVRLVQSKVYGALHDYIRRRDQNRDILTCHISYAKPLPVLPPAPPLFRD